MLAVLDGDDQQVFVHAAVLIEGGQAGGALPLGAGNVAVQGLAVGVVLAVSNAALDSILDDVHSIVRLRGVLVVAAAVQLVVLLVEFLDLFIGVGSIKRGGDHHAVDSVTAQVGQLGRVVALADAGQVDAVLLHLAADHSDLGVIAPEDNKVRIGLLDLAQRHGEVGVARVVDFVVYHFQAEVIADGAGNLETTGAEVGGLVQDGESLGVVFIDHVAHDVAHMQLIGGGQLVDVVVAALGDSNVGGSRGDLGNLGGLGDLHVGQGAGRSLGADNGVDLVLLHQLLHGGHGGGRHTFIIDGNEVDGDGAIDAASGVDLVNGHLGSVLHDLAGHGRGAGQRADQAQVESAFDAGRFNSTGSSGTGSRSSGGSRAAAGSCGKAHGRGHDPSHCLFHS